MNTKALYGVLALIVVIGGGFLVFGGGPADYSAITTYDQCAAAGYPIMESYPEQCATPDGRSFTRVILTSNVSDLIRVDAPIADALVSSPLLIEGEARGTWYFEASFPVELVDADGIRLAQGPMAAHRDWMTENFVPFSGTLTFKAPTTETGTLIVRNDNPSGLEENAREIRIPVKFSSVAPRPAKLSVDGQLTVGDRLVYEDGLVVALKEISDSRCAPDVQCVWAGELSALLLVGENKEEVRLGTVNNKSVSYGGHLFTLTKATESAATIRVDKSLAVKTGVVSGYVHVGPTCPVAHDPPDNSCADKPHVVTIEIHYLNERLHSTVKSAADGRFSVILPMGEYILRPQAAGVLPSCTEERVVVLAGKTVEVDISCDSGIR